MVPQVIMTLVLVEVPLVHILYGGYFVGGRYDRCPASGSCGAIDMENSRDMHIRRKRAEPKTPAKCCKNLGILCFEICSSNNYNSLKYKQ